MQAQYEISASCFHLGDKDGGKFLRRFCEELPVARSQGDWPEEHGLGWESSSCTDLHVGVHLTTAWSFQREIKSTLVATGIASATAGDCSWIGILFYQERSVVFWHWAGMVLLSWYHFFTPLKCFLDWIIRHKICLHTAALGTSLCKRCLLGCLFLHNLF